MILTEPYDYPMFLNLNPNMIGVGADLATSVQYAAAHGFGGIDFSISEASALADEQGPHYVQAIFGEHRVRPGVWGLPVDFRSDKDEWEDGLALLPRYAQLAQELGALRTNTWILPGSDERNFDENFAFHVERLRPIAEILNNYGCRFGLEWVGPQTLRNRFQHEFIHTMDGMLTLAKEIGTGNLGLLVDSFHLYTSHASMDDVRRLSNRDVVNVHVNDALANRGPDEQIDNERALPTETGVHDLTRFLHALRDIGYDGPLTAEPFSQRLRDLQDEQAVRETAAAMQKMWSQAGMGE